MFQIDVSYLQGTEPSRPSDSQDRSNVLWSRRFIYSFHKSLPLVPILEKSIQFTLFHSVSSKYILLLRSELSLSFRLYKQKPLLYPLRATCPANLILIELITRVMCAEEQNKRSYYLHSFPHCLVTSSVCRVPCFLRHPVFKHCQPTFVLISPFIVTGYSPLVSTNAHSFIHSVFCLTTGLKPPPKQRLHIVRSRASSFK